MKNAHKAQKHMVHNELNCGTSVVWVTGFREQSYNPRTCSISHHCSLHFDCDRSMSDFLDVALSYRLDHTFPVAVFSDLRANRNQWTTKHHLEMTRLPSSLSTYVCPGDKAPSGHHGNRPPHYSSRIHYGVVSWRPDQSKIQQMIPQSEHESCFFYSLLRLHEMCPRNLLSIFSCCYLQTLPGIAEMKWLSNSLLYRQYSFHCPCGKWPLSILFSSLMHI